MSIARSSSKPNDVPKLRGDVVIAVPVIHIEDGEPELAPGWCAHGAAELVQARTGFHCDRMVGLHTEDTHGAIVQRRAEDSAWAFNVATGHLFSYR